MELPQYSFKFFVIYLEACERTVLIYVYLFMDLLQTGLSILWDLIFFMGSALEMGKILRFYLTVWNMAGMYYQYGNTPMQIYWKFYNKKKKKKKKKGKHFR